MTGHHMFGGGSIFSRQLADGGQLDHFQSLGAIMGILGMHLNIES